jgi:DNA-binding helix-hairpin-helix protein with protein kinase domain
MKAPAVYDSKGPLPLGAAFKQGGEGAIHEIVGKPDLVAKLYHKAISPEKADKILAMASMRTDRLTAISAWPIDLLRNTKREPCGLVMQRVSGFRDIHTLYGPRSRKTEFPEADWSFLARAASNLARAMGEIHQAGCVIGDVNEGGFMVSSKALVKIIDCDSFQVQAGGRQFLCEVGIPMFTPPELQGGSTFRVGRTPNHDGFGLAVLIFHLLFLGRHPFAGRFLGKGDPQIEDHIAGYRFAYGAARGTVQMQPPPHMPTLDLVPTSVGGLFERAFSREGARDGSRPTPLEWVRALDELQRSLARCPANSAHNYPDTGRGCPWCQAERGMGTVLFIAQVKVTPAGPAFDLALVWAKIQAVPRPAAAPAPKTRAEIGNLTPSPEAQAAARRAFGIQLAPLAVVGVIFAALILVFTPLSLIFGVPVLLFLVLQPVGVATFQSEKRAAMTAWQATLTQQSGLSEEAFDRVRAELQQAHQELASLGPTRQQRLQKLQAEVAARQLECFLEGHRIANARISGIGPGRKVTLESYGIETANDVSEASVMAVPSFGPKLARRLADWRRDLEKRFVYQPQLGVDPRDLAALDAQMKALQNKLETQLASGPTRLETARMQIDMARGALKAQLDLALTRLLQAETNYRTATGTGATMVAWLIGAGWLAASLLWLFLVGRLAAISSLESSPPRPSPTPAFIAPTPAPAPPASPATLQLTRDCELWGFDADGRSVVVAQGHARDRHAIVALDEQSAQIQLLDGTSAWVVRSCTDLR